ncbi:MAG: hemolysin family protein [Cytophaga sp.]|uniref:hemolysin family protein n=1 Tax=Cytophaga sp. TaxID=29535 RepID=UPI003F7E2093
MILLYIFITLFLVALNGFFVAAEFAIVKVRSSQLEVKASTGNSRAQVALLILQNLDEYLSATQFGITLASLGLGWAGERVVMPLVSAAFDMFAISIPEIYLHEISFGMSFTLITIMHIVFGELAPKSIAIQRAESVALGIAYPLRVFYLIFKPFIYLLNGFASFILKLAGFSNASEKELHSAEELELLIDQGRISGALDVSEHQLIKNVFGFIDVTVRQVMTPRTSINAIDIDLPLEYILTKVVNEGYSRLPVYKDNIDNIIGVLYTKDLLKMMNKGDTIELQAAMRPPYFVPETKKINELLKNLQAKHLHMAVIIDEFGGVAGIATIEDIIEELVGEIQDEHDDEAPVVEQVAADEYIVNALANIQDVNELLPVPLPEGAEYDTLAGLLIKLFSRIPDLSEKITFENYQFTILKKTKQSILLVKLNRIELSEET